MVPLNSTLNFVLEKVQKHFPSRKNNQVLTIFLREMDTESLKCYWVLRNFENFLKTKSLI